MKNKLLYALSALILLSLSCSVFGGNNALPTAEVRLVPATPTGQPTFTATPPMSAIVAVPTATIPPTETPIPIEVAPTETPLPTNTPVPAAKVSIVQVMNVRSGPGTNYPKIGQVSVGHTSDILGRNNDASWLQINTPGGLGWVFAQLTQVEGDANTAPVVEAAAPPPTNTPAPPPPPTNTPVPQPKYQYVVTNVFAKENKAMTQIKGIIKDSAGNPVNGMHVRVRSGSFCTISFKSGPWKDANGQPSGYQPGEYDIYLGNGERIVTWQVDIVPNTAPNDSSECRNMQPLSETKDVQSGIGSSIVHVEWKKNW